MIFEVEEAENKEVALPTPWVRFFMRLAKLSKGRRYQITLDIDPILGPSWSVIDLGKIERGSRLGAYTNGNGRE